jgi:hypothetical protein
VTRKSLGRFRFGPFLLEVGWVFPVWRKVAKSHTDDPGESRSSRLQARLRARSKSWNCVQSRGQSRGSTIYSHPDVTGGGDRSASGSECVLNHAGAMGAGRCEIGWHSSGSVDREAANPEALK